MRDRTGDRISPWADMVVIGAILASHHLVIGTLIGPSTHFKWR